MEVKRYVTVSFIISGAVFAGLFVLQAICLT
jgi:hypothetical protein